MPNVDRCTRLAESGLCGDAAEKAREIAALESGLQNQIFRGKNAKTIEKMLVRYAQAIRTAVGERYGLRVARLVPSSDNNRDGADLVGELVDGTTVTIEVKFGSYTDKAAGMAAFARIFGTRVFSEALSIGQRKEWRTLVATEYPSFAQQSERLQATLNLAVKEFNRLYAGRPITTQAEMESYLLNNSGGYEERPERYMRFETDKTGQKFVERAPVEKGVGEWMVEEVSLLDFTGGSHRVNVFIENTATKVRIKFVLNNKNNYKLKTQDRGDIKVDSKYMLGSPSWNVWVYPPRRSGADRG